MFINLEACLFLSELSGLARALELDEKLRKVCVAGMSSTCSISGMWECWCMKVARVISQSRDAEVTEGGICVICALWWQVKEEERILISIYVLCT